MEMKDLQLQSITGGAKKAGAARDHAPTGLKQLQRLAGNNRFGRLLAGVQRTELPAPVRKGIERLGGVRMDGVRVHHDSPEPAKLGAVAWAHGSDIHLGPGQERHLPHEAWHVAQQRQGRVAAPHIRIGEVPVNDDRALEKEADQVGPLISVPAPAGEARAVEPEASDPGTVTPALQMKKPEWYEAHAHQPPDGREYPSHDCGCPVGSETFAVPGGRVAIGLRKARMLYRDGGHRDGGLRDGAKQQHRPDPPMPSRWWPKPVIAEPPDPDPKTSA